MKEISRTLCCNSPTYSQAARSLCACPCREAFGVRRIPALCFRVVQGCLERSKRKRRDAAHSKRFARFGCGFAALWKASLPGVYAALFASQLLAADLPLKQHATFYAPEHLAQIRANVRKDPWAIKLRDDVLAEIDPWMKLSDAELWELMFGATIPRSWMVWSNGGLLGHWAVWTRRAVELLNECHAATRSHEAISEKLLQRSGEITDCNAAFFDAANGFRGCIAGLHEVLRRQGLLEGIWCLDPNKTLSSGQAAEIERVCRAYPHLNDDQFVAAHRDEWLN